MPLLARLLATALLAVVVAGCAGRQPPQPDYDPWQPLNRKVFWFNDQLDTYALEPVARGWNYVVPDPVQRGISNFFNNLRIPVIVFPNDLLQGKPHKAAEAFARFWLNTVWGGLGFYDFAAKFGAPPQDEDFGQTFGVWGIPPGPYLVLPVFGPSNPRDTVGLGCDFATGVYIYFTAIPWIATAGTAVNVVNDRSRVLDEVKNAKEASFDFYTFVRNAYVQRRWKQINDTLSVGTPQEEEDLYNEEIYENYLEHGDKP
jgi:phospholipid-binding lipoprotein MlaA